MGNGGAGVLRTRSNDDREVGTHQIGHTLLSLLVAKQWPITHGATVHDTVHSMGDQKLSLLYQCLKINLARFGTRRH
jgi:hypothetical protein